MCVELGIHSSICLMFQKVNGLHSFELELVGDECIWISGFSDTATETRILFCLRRLSDTFGIEMRTRAWI